MGAAWYLDFNSIKVQLELSNDSECYESKVDFNSIKVQLEHATLNITQSTGEISIP